MPTGLFFINTPITSSNKRLKQVLYCLLLQVQKLMTNFSGWI
jgi:hypothetical protein